MPSVLFLRRWTPLLLSLHFFCGCWNGQQQAAAFRGGGLPRGKGHSMNHDGAASRCLHTSTMTSVSRCFLHMSGDDRLSERNSDEIRQDEDAALLGSDALMDEYSSSLLLQALNQRVVALEEGIGKRYVCRTQIGFLNIHEAPEDPYRTDNVVGRLVDGDIVVSTGPREGDWIQHDGGGWSIAVHGNFVWLEELKE